MYQWLVFTHLVGLVVFAMCHGVAIFSAFRISSLRDTAAVRVVGKDGAAPAEGEALARALDSRRPEILLAIGGGGLLVLIWLMALKPG